MSPTSRTYTTTCGSTCPGTSRKRCRFFGFTRTPLVSLDKVYQLEKALDEALSPRVWLKSGGYLVIEPTEALTVIDVNTGKYAGKKNQQGDH